MDFPRSFCLVGNENTLGFAVLIEVAIQILPTASVPPLLNASILSSLLPAQAQMEATAWAGGRCSWVPAGVACPAQNIMVLMELAPEDFPPPGVGCSAGNKEPSG